MKPVLRAIKKLRVRLVFFIAARLSLARQFQVPESKRRGSKTPTSRGKYTPPDTNYPAEPAAYSIWLADPT